jgi:uncharacterized membrane protein (DUF373 family)
LEGFPHPKNAGSLRAFKQKRKIMKIPSMNSEFNLSIRIIIIILTMFIIAVLVAGLVHTVWGIKELLFAKSSLGQSFNVIVVNILTFLVIIELFRGFWSISRCTGFA